MAHDSRPPDPGMPRLSVIVRSYNRLPALAELLVALLAQDHDSFEIVVIEQTPAHASAAPERARIDELARDPRVRVLSHPPLGGPGARNAGVRSARGELLVFIDDDDLPASTDWLRRHEANFDDPRCLGVTGQFIDDRGTPPVGSAAEGRCGSIDDRGTPPVGSAAEGRCGSIDDRGTPYVNMARARRQVLSFNLLKWQRVYARTDERKRVESLMGGNAAIPRATLERFGLWDECTPIEDEPSLSYRINAGKRADEYLLFDPAPKMIRRLDVPGGMAKRTMSGPVYARRVFTFLHNIIGHYFPIRFALLYPAYIYFVAYHVIQWICSDSKKHQTLVRRIWATSGIILALLPLWAVWVAEWWYRRLRDGEAMHRPELSPQVVTSATPSELADREGFAPSRVA